MHHSINQDYCNKSFVFAFGVKDNVRHIFKSNDLAELNRFNAFGFENESNFVMDIWIGAKTPIYHIPLSKSGWQGCVIGRIFDTEDGKYESAVKRIFAAIESNHWHQLQDLGGLFIAAIFNLQKGILHIINDALGVRPFFLMDRDDTALGASHAFLLSPYIIGSRRANLTAVSQYLIFGYNASRHSLIDGIWKPLPASVATWQRGVFKETGYTREIEQKKSIGKDAMAEKIHGIMTTSYRHWTQGDQSLVAGLSGGYDSRYLAALGSTEGSCHVQYVNVSSEPRETIIAQKVANALDLPLEVIPVQGAKWDWYFPEDVFHLRPDGFPVTKSVCRLVARAKPSWPVIDGYLGDALVGGHFDHLTLEVHESSSEAFASILWKIMGEGLKALYPKGYNMLLKVALKEASDIKKSFGVICQDVTFIDLYFRQKAYIDNNFVQNMHETEPVLPFLSPKLIRAKMEYPFQDFGRQTYDYIYSMYFPELASLGHNKDLPEPQMRGQVGKTQRKWIAHIIWRYLQRRLPDLLDRSYLFPRLLSAAMRTNHGYVVCAAIFCVMLDDICRMNDVEIDWTFNNIF